MGRFFVFNAKKGLHFTLFLSDYILNLITTCSRQENLLFNLSSPALLLLSLELRHYLAEVILTKKSTSRILAIKRERQNKRLFIH